MANPPTTSKLPPSQILGSTMNLQQIIADRDALPENHFICARKPWQKDSESILIPYPEDLGIPAEIKAKGFMYFLEVDIVREILEPFLAVNPTPDQIFAFVLYYAEYDAYPDWSHELLL
jgi:hypothetical protein